jgi:L-rhamnono-1,4-lactonase
MKFSGAFNEFIDTPSSSSTPSDIPTLVTTLSPFFNHVMECFGAHRVMFGSDWPVCNVGGPNGEAGNWNLWREVVQAWMDARGLSADERDAVWWRTGCEAYALDGVI